MLARLQQPTIPVKHDSDFSTYVNQLKKQAEHELSAKKLQITDAPINAVVEMLRKFHVEVDIQSGKKAWDWVFFFSYKSLVGCLDYLRPHKLYKNVVNDVRFTVNSKTEKLADIVETMCNGDLEKQFNARKAAAIQEHNKALKEAADKKAKWDAHEAEIKRRDDERLKQQESIRVQEEAVRKEREKQLAERNRLNQIERYQQRKKEALQWGFASAVPQSGNPIPRVGLPNLGNTCYMNSVLQVLQVSRLSNLITKAQLPVAQNNPMGSKGLVTNTVRQLFIAMGAGSQGTMYKSPVQSLIGNFKNVIQKRYDLFEGNQQQCAGEFLTVLIDNLHEDANMARNIMGSNPRRPEVAAPPSLSDADLLAASKQSVATTDKSPIFDLLAFQEMSVLGCSICGAKSRTVAPRMGLELDLIKDVPETTLDVCIRNYLSQEYLGSTDTWTCSGCGHKSHAMKQLQLYSPPPMLSIVLKRFGGIGLHGSTAQKKSMKVAFPKELDLSEYFQAEEFLTVYDLIGIVNHHGNTTTSGHYTADALGRDNRWFSISDEKCVPSKGGPDFSTAYMLLFQKKDVKIPKRSMDTATTDPATSATGEFFLVGSTVGSIIDPSRRGKVVSMNYDNMKYEILWSDGTKSLHAGSELQQVDQLSTVAPSQVVQPPPPVMPPVVQPPVSVPVPAPVPTTVPTTVPVVAPAVAPAARFVVGQTVLYTDSLDMQSQIVTIVSAPVPGAYTIRLSTGAVRDVLETDLSIASGTAPAPPPSAPIPPAPIPSPAQFTVGDNLLYLDNKVGREVPVTVVKVDMMLQPPGYIIKLPDGQERSTEGNRLRHFEDVLPGSTPNLHTDPMQPPPPAVSAPPPPPPPATNPSPVPGDEFVKRITELSDKLGILKQQLDQKHFQPEMLTVQQQVDTLRKDISSTSGLTDEFRSASKSIIEALDDQAKSISLQGRMLQLTQGG
eukprot:TRINITY_DN990_c0_g2_i3.p1 TRINITY_DN990_c0_g2~~TRINITY_DN990_c0_g2_i3.p1  ORF type:complete len:976 (+),score=210.81 TRINITY_DN990_c0_g2_i3:79-2928(+)